jgi:predicted metal-dependent hydrolase
MPTLRQDNLPAHMPNSHDTRYLGFFQCFNDALYYEAHEVLEDLWHTVRPAGPNATYYKGLIQLAGAFTHLKLHACAPQHPIHSRRLRPAAKLFTLCLDNLAPYPTSHLGSDVDLARTLAATYRQRLLDTRYAVNPLDLKQPPWLPLPENFMGWNPQ